MKQRNAPAALVVIFALSFAGCGPVQWQTEKDRLALDQLRNDWAKLNRYRDADAKIGPPSPGENRVVFMGDSITDLWISTQPAFFAGKPYFDRGIGGQATSQMLLRFRQDVIALRPKVVVILGGTNDIDNATGPTTPEMTHANIESMVELARANGITVVLASLLPAWDVFLHSRVHPAPLIAAMNAWIKDYAARHDIVYLDYYSAMVDSRPGLKAELTYDGVHPNAAGFAVMAPLAEDAIARALRQAAARNTPSR